MLVKIRLPLELMNFHNLKMYFSEITLVLTRFVVLMTFKTENQLDFNELFNWRRG
jgi:hypothetical protein